MRKWNVTFIFEDDGMEDPEEEIKGRYFTKKELKEIVESTATSGLKTRSISIKRIR